MCRSIDRGDRWEGSMKNDFLEFEAGHFFMERQQNCDMVGSVNPSEAL
jgi:hypothetical protein